LKNGRDGRGVIQNQGRTTTQRSRKPGVVTGKNDGTGIDDQAARKSVVAGKFQRTRPTLDQRGTGPGNNGPDGQGVGGDINTGRPVKRQIDRTRSEVERIGADKSVRARPSLGVVTQQGQRRARKIIKRNANHGEGTGAESPGVTEGQDAAGNSHATGGSGIVAI